MQTKKILTVKNLSINLNQHNSKDKLKIVDDISFCLFEKETLGIIGESGCGKSLTAMSLLKLLPRSTLYQGSVNFDGLNLLTVNNSILRKIRGKKISMIFQEPISSLNPCIKVGDQIKEAITVHNESISSKQAKSKVFKLLDQVQIPNIEKTYYSYSHQLSGGQIQRIMIAMAISCHPEILIADECTTALDVTIQAQIINLLKDLQAHYSMSIIIITHDLGIIASMCHRVMVMYAGRLVEIAPTAKLFDNSVHPYTKGLMSIQVGEKRLTNNYRLPIIKGQVEQVKDWTDGCRFYKRCEFSKELCNKKHPPMQYLRPFNKTNKDININIDNDNIDKDSHLYACYNPQ